MTVHDGGFKHTAQKAEHLKGSVLALTLVAGRSNGCFFMVQQPCPGSLSPGLLVNACTITYLTRWKERGTIRFIPELVHNLASALTLRAPLLLRIFFTTIGAVASEAYKIRVRFSKAIYIIAKYCIDIMIDLVSRIKRLLAFLSFKLSLWCFPKIILA